MTTSGGPIWEAEGLDPLALIEAGWSEHDLVWERLQAQAAEASLAGGAHEAAASWAEALRIARDRFAGNDPRLATSLTNHAVGLRRAGRAQAAERLLQEALLIWDASGVWVASMKAEQRARSSTFHLRLARKNPGLFERSAKEHTAALAVQGRALIQAWRGGSAAPDDRLSRWRTERPAGFTDARKLMAAVYLIAPAPSSTVS